VASLAHRTGAERVILRSGSVSSLTGGMSDVGSRGEPRTHGGDQKEDDVERGPNKAKPKRGSAFEKLQREREAKGVEEDLERDEEEREERKQIRQEEREEREQIRQEEREERKQEREKARAQEESS
jgi:hypothetical protein